MPPEKVDFQELVSQLYAWGYSDTAIADETGVGRTMVMRLRKGERNQPNYNDGAELVAFHKKVAKKESKNSP